MAHIMKRVLVNWFVCRETLWCRPIAAVRDLFNILSITLSLLNWKLLQLEWVFKTNLCSLTSSTSISFWLRSNIHILNIKDMCWLYRILLLRLHNFTVNICFDSWNLVQSKLHHNKYDFSTYSDKNNIETTFAYKIKTKTIISVYYLSTFLCHWVLNVCKFCNNFTFCWQNTSTNRNTFPFSCKLNGLVKDKLHKVFVCQCVENLNFCSKLNVTKSCV